MHRHTCNYIKYMHAYIRGNAHRRQSPVSWLDHPHLCRQRVTLASKLTGLQTAPTTGRHTERKPLHPFAADTVGLQQPHLLWEASALPEATFPPNAFGEGDVLPLSLHPGLLSSKKKVT